MITEAPKRLAKCHGFQRPEGWSGKARSQRLHNRHSFLPFPPQMITSKRRTPTTDDLLRMQEEPWKRHKQLPLAQRDEDEGSDAGEDGLAPEDWGVEWDGGGEWENGADESTDSEIGEESPLVEHGRIGHLNESSSLLGSRVNAKPRLVHHHTTLSPGVGKPVTFSSLGISPPLLSALSKMAIHAPTEIQQACIPPLLAGLLLGSGYLTFTDTCF